MVNPNVYPKHIQKERQRCLALVRAYREQIEEGIQRQKIITGSLRTFRQEYFQEIGEKVVKSLLEIERRIEHPSPAKTDGDFSLDEMAIAEQLIAEQEHNPFEG